MKFNKHYCYVFFFLVVVSGAGCSTAPTTAINTNSNTAVVVNSNVANAATANIAATPAASVSPISTTTGSPSATVTAYYQAMVKKDELAFRQVLSMPTLKEYSAQAKEDGEKTLVGWYTGFSAPPKQPYETRNERISGDTALIEIKDGDVWYWKQLVRENGQWKMDLTNSTAQKMLDLNKKNK